MDQPIFDAVVTADQVGAAVDASLAPGTGLAGDGSQSLTDILESSDAADEEHNDAGTERDGTTVGRKDRASEGRYKEAERRAFDRAYQKLSTEFEAKLNDRLAPLMQAHFETTAREIAAAENVSIDVARELAQFRASNATRGIDQQGQGRVARRGATAAQGEALAQPNTAAPERDARGRFVPAQADPGLSARTAQLREQAAEIQRDFGLDMVALFRDDPEIRTNVSAGRWDFFRALAAYDRRQSKQGQGRATQGTDLAHDDPPVIRSSNYSDSTVSVANMSDDDLDKVLLAVKRGKTVRFD